MQTTSPPSTPPSAPAEPRSGERAGGLAALCAVIGATAVTAAWIYVLVLLAGRLVAAVF